MAAFTLHVICLCTCSAYCFADPHTQRCCSLHSFGRARSQARILSCSSGSWVYGRTMSSIRRNILLVSPLVEMLSPTNYIASPACCASDASTQLDQKPDG
eukprot:15688-Heterococcus_DN1.PRE.2